MNAPTKTATPQRAAELFALRQAAYFAEAFKELAAKFSNLSRAMELAVADENYALMVSSRNGLVDFRDRTSEMLELMGEKVIGRAEAQFRREF